MKEMRLRPKGDYLHTATWEELYVLADHWQSDMEFYRDEIEFFYKLIDKYFIWLTKDESITQVQTMAARLSAMSRERENISERIEKHKQDLALLMENSFTESENWFRQEHVNLEEDLSDFVKDFRDLKKKVFSISEHIIESEKLQHLLTE